MTAQDGSAALAHGGGPVLDAAGWATWVVGPEYPSRVARASLRAASPVLLVLPVGFAVLILATARGVMLAVDGLILVLVVVLFAWVVRRSTRRQVARFFPPGAQLHLRILVDQIQIQAPLVASQQPWAAFRGVRVVHDMVILRQVSGAQQILPVELFGPAGVAFVTQQVAAAVHP